MSESLHDDAKELHPYCIQPWGSRLLIGGNGPDIRNTGLGALACLDDGLLLSLLGLLPGRNLARAAAASKSLYCFANHEPLWKALAVEELQDFTYSGSWQETYVRHSRNGRRDFRRGPPLRVAGFFSDTLYQSWHFARASLRREWLERDNIPRREAANLTASQFREQFEAPNQPMILTGEVTRWPAFQKWTQTHLRQALEGRQLNAGGCRLSFDNYLAYSTHSRDELPLYLFDKQCLGWTNEASQHSLADDYKVPEYFAEDLFSVMGDERPDFRWLIVGPAKSGSSFHKDPNSTSAWNAVISGTKKWMLWPPHTPPPGVYPSADGLEVSSPYTLQEWFDSFYEYAQEEPAMLEGICRAGELLFVPRGWWHLAVNLEETTAITQNYVSTCNLPHVLRHLQDPNLISGCSVEERATLHDRFVEALHRNRPAVLDHLDKERAVKKRKAAEQQALSSLFITTDALQAADADQHEEKRRRRVSEAPASGSGQSSRNKQPSTFSFGFAIDNVS